MESTRTDISHEFAALAKCAHPACICTVVEGERFCSDHCASHVGVGDAAAHDDCDCGHSECASFMRKREEPPVVIGTA